jgi:hypothetical protein
MVSAAFGFIPHLVLEQGSGDRNYIDAAQLRRSYLKMGDNAVSEALFRITVDSVSNKNKKMDKS